MPAEPITYKLKDPVKVGSELLEELRFRAPTAGDMRSFCYKEERPYDGILTMAGKLSGQLDVTINQLSIDDFDEVVKIVQGFIVRSPTTGSAPSPS